MANDETEDEEDPFAISPLAPVFWLFFVLEIIRCIY